MPELLDELTLAKLAADGSYRKLIKKYSKADLFILDEWLLTELLTDEATILLEITESRHKYSIYYNLFTNRSKWMALEVR